MKGDLIFELQSLGVDLGGDDINDCHKDRKGIERDPSDRKKCIRLTEILNDPEARELSSETFLPHIVRSLESLISDIDEVHNYLDRICLNSVKHPDEENNAVSLWDFAASVCDDHCDKVRIAKSQKELDSFCRECAFASKLEEGRC